jgi:hypothetical protein
MGEFKDGKLKSGSGRKVKKRRQAVAIAMSESGQSRARKKTASGAKKTTARKRASPAKRKK